MNAFRISESTVNATKQNKYIMQHTNILLCSVAILIFFFIITGNYSTKSLLLFIMWVCVCVCGRLLEKDAAFRCFFSVSCVYRFIGILQCAPNRLYFVAVYAAKVSGSFRMIFVAQSASWVCFVVLNNNLMQCMIYMNALLWIYIFFFVLSVVRAVGEKLNKLTSRVCRQTIYGTKNFSLWEMQRRVRTNIHIYQYIQYAIYVLIYIYY